MTGRIRSWFIPTLEEHTDDLRATLTAQVKALVEAERREARADGLAQAAAIFVAAANHTFLLGKDAIEARAILAVAETVTEIAREQRRIAKEECDAITFPS